MKYLFPILCFLSIAATAQTDSKQFVEEARKNHKVLDMSFSGGLITMALGDELNEELQGLTDRITEVTWFATEDGSNALSKDLDRFEKQIKRSGFELLATVRHEGADVQVLIQEANGQISEIVAFARDGTDIFFASVTGNFNFQDIETMKVISEDWDK